MGKDNQNPLLRLSRHGAASRKLELYRLPVYESEICLHD